MNGHSDGTCICDECLVRMIEKGESTIGFMGWSLWYERDFPQLIKFTRRRLSKWRLNHLSEDIAQDAFLRGWTNIVSGRFVFTGRSLLAYLFGITKNLIRERIRKSTRESNQLHEDYELVSNRLSPEQDVMLQEHIDLISAGFDLLKPIQQQILFSTYNQGKRSAEIAQMTGFTQENARIIAMRGIKSIQRTVEQKFGIEMSANAIRSGLEFVPPPESLAQAAG